MRSTNSAIKTGNSHAPNKFQDHYKDSHTSAENVDQEYQQLFQYSFSVPRSILFNGKIKHRGIL
jgi:hypothetical protein